MLPIVSIVLSAYNSENYIDEAIESLLSQNFRDFECITIDDGSTDETGDRMDKFKRDPRVIVIHARHRGCVSSLNLACALAKGQYIARMDSDDIAMPYRIQCQVNYFETHPSVGLLGGAVELIGATHEISQTIRFPIDDEDIRAHLASGNCFSHPTVMIRRSIFNLVGGYRKAFEYAEDYDLWLRVAEQCKVANLPDVLVQYRLHRDQVSFRHLEQQTFAILAARAGAAIRRAEGQDPLIGKSAITSDILGELGISNDEINRAVRRSYNVALGFALDLKTAEHEIEELLMRISKLSGVA
jgi:glycosyltransferase involved in cell wall biosynthesis